MRGLSVLRRHAGPELILFLHGLGCVKECFEGAWEEDALAGVSLLAPDLPGSGASPAPAGFGGAMEEHASAVLELLEDMDFARLHVVAHSMGGAVGLLLARQVSPASFICVEGNLIAADCSLLSRRAAATPRRSFVAGKFDGLRRASAGSGDPWLEAWAGWASAADAGLFHAACVSLVRWSDSGLLMEIFESLNGRKAYIHGERSTNESVLEALGPIPVTAIPGSGHFPMTEKPGTFYAATAAIIGRAPRAGGGALS